MEATQAMTGAAEAVTAALRAPAWPAAGVYVAGPRDIVVEVTAHAAGIAPVRIRLDGIDAALVVEDDALDSWVRADLDPASARSGFRARDALLRRPPALDVDEFGVIRVESVEITAHHGLTFAVQCDLYVKDLVTELPLDVRLTVADPTTVLVSAHASFDRRALELALPMPWDRLIARRVDVRAGIAFHRSTADLEVPA